MTVDNGQLFYEIEGSGHPLVLIHAGFLDRRMWDPQFQSYSEKYRVVRYDVRGFGRSSKAENKYSDVEDLHSLLVELGIDRASLIGCSNGGRIAIDFATNYPGKVDGLVLVGSGVSGYKNTPEEDRVWKEFDARMSSQEDLVKQGRFVESSRMDVDAWASMQNPTSRERLLKIALDNAPVQAENPWKLQVSPDPKGFDRLHEISVPTLVIVGDKDVNGMGMIAETIHSKIRGSKKLVIKGADHIVNLSRSEEFDNAVLSFLEKVRP